MTFALLPLGPFFWGMALYVHVRPAAVQFLQGRVPSPMHLTFLLWQQSHARLTADVAGPVESGIINNGINTLPGTRCDGEKSRPVYR